MSAVNYRSRNFHFSEGEESIIRLRKRFCFVIHPSVSCFERMNYKLVQCNDEPNFVMNSTFYKERLGTERPNSHVSMVFITEPMNSMVKNKNAPFSIKYLGTSGRILRCIFEKKKKLMES